MEVEMPDGTIIEDVPEDMTQAELMRRYELYKNPPTIYQKIGRQLGLAGRYMVEGATALPSMFGGGINAAINLGADALGFVDRSAVTGEKQYPLQHPSQIVSQGLDELGFPSPASRSERLVSGPARFGAGAMAGVGAGGQIPGVVGSALRAAPGGQAIAAATGGGASAAAAELGYGPVVQGVAGMTGSAIPAMAPGATAMATRSFLRGSSPATMQENIQLFRNVGTTPTVGQASGLRRSQFLESTASKFPGGAGPIHAKARQQAAEIKAHNDLLADQIARGADAGAAGRAIERGVTGFVARFRTTKAALYDAAERLIAPDTQITPTATAKLLDELTSPVQGAEQTGRVLLNPKVRAIGEAFLDDLTNPANANGTMPFSALRQLRSRVGGMLDEGFFTDMPRGDLKRLYGALSEDLKAATAGNLRARAAMARADRYYQAGLQRVETLERIINKNGGPEFVYKAAFSGSKDSATTIATVYRSLKPDERNIITAAFIKRMGKAPPGLQDETGELFSINRFLSEYNSLHPRARAIIFGSPGTRYRQNMEGLAKIAAEVKAGNMVFANPSQTSGGLISSGFYASTFFSVFSRNMEAINAQLAFLGANYSMAAALTNPKFVNWLAQNAYKPGASAPAIINSLAQLARNSNDRELAYMAAASQTAMQQQAAAEQ